MELLNLEFHVLFLLILCLMNLFFSYHSFKKRRQVKTLVSGLINIALSTFFPWTIGPVLLAIGIIQLFISFMNVVKVQSAK